jgi:UPF0755 protein
MQSREIVATSKNFIIEKGDGVFTVARKLHEQKIITSIATFPILSRIWLMVKNKEYRYGEYQLQQGMTFQNLLSKLTSGDFYYRKITIPEGLTIYQIQEIMEKENGLIGTFPSEIKEGTLMPESYKFTAGNTKKQIIQKMQIDMQDFIQKEWSKRDEIIDSVIKTPEEAIILASIVEKETELASERPHIASVFMNRLKIGMRLQTDPTIVYMLSAKRGTALNRPLNHEDLWFNSPYNTYRNKGLTPTPICNPGKDAILAVLHPLKTFDLYFVATGNGGHNFSRDFQTHINSKINYKKIRKKIKAESQ